MEDPLGVVKTFASIQVSADSRWCRKVRKKRHEGVFVVYKGETGFAAEAFRDGWVMGVGGGRDRIVALGRVRKGKCRL